MAKLPETKDETKSRLQATGQWKEFWTLRDELKAEGMAPAESHRAALKAYPNPEWGSEEMLLLDPSMDVKTASKPKVTHTLTQKPQQKVIKVDEVQKKLADKNKAPELITFEELKKWHDAHKDKKPANAYDENKWISDHIGVKVPWEDAISPGAWFMLQEIQADKEIKKAWRKEIYSKLIPSRSVLEKSEHMQATDTATEQLVKRLLKHTNENDTEAV